jgi:hypothetical protein
MNYKVMLIIILSYQVLSTFTEIPATTENLELPGAFSPDNIIIQKVLEGIF